MDPVTLHPRLLYAFPIGNEEECEGEILIPTLVPESSTPLDKGFLVAVVSTPTEDDDSEFRLQVIAHGDSYAEFVSDSLRHLLHRQVRGLALHHGAGVCHSKLIDPESGVGLSSVKFHDASHDTVVVKIMVAGAELPENLTCRIVRRNDGDDANVALLCELSCLRRQVAHLEARVDGSEYGCRLSDTQTDLFDQISKDIALRPNCHVFRFLLERSETSYVWKKPLVVSPFTSVTVEGVGYKNYAKEIGVTIDMSGGVKDCVYNDVRYASFHRVQVGTHAYFGLCGVNLVQDDDEILSGLTLTQSSSIAALFVINGDFGTVSLIQSRVKMNVWNLVSVSGHYFGKVNFGHTWIENTGRREVYAARAYSGWSFQNAKVLVSSSHTHCSASAGDEFVPKIESCHFE